MRIRTKAVPTMRADEFFDSVYEFCRSESECKSYSDRYRDGMKRIMIVLQSLNMIVKSSNLVGEELLEILIRTLRRRVDERFERALESTEYWMRRIVGVEGVSV